MRAIALVTVATLAAASARAQTTWLVGPGGFSQIHAAVGAAQPGDILRVDSGTYEPFVVPFALSIVATGQVIVRPPGVGSSSFSSTSFEPPSGQQVLVRGLTFEGNGALHAHSVYAQFGQVVFQSCHFTGGHPYKVSYGLSCISSADVVLLNCSFQTAHACVGVSSGSLVANSTSMVATWLAAIPEPICGIHASNAKVNLSGCTLQGAHRPPSYVGGPADPGMVAAGTSRVRLARCTVTGGNSSIYAGPPGLLNLTSQPIRHWQCTVTGGLGSISGQPANGPAFQGPQLAAVLLTTASTSLATPFAMSNRSEPARLIAVGFTFDLAPPTALAFAEPFVRFDPATVVPWSFGVTDAAGFYQTPATAAASGPAVFGRTLWLHPLLLDGGIFVAGNPAGLIIP